AVSAYADVEAPFSLRFQDNAVRWCLSIEQQVSSYPHSSGDCGAGNGADLEESLVDTSVLGDLDGPGPEQFAKLSLGFFVFLQGCADYILGLLVCAGGDVGSELVGVLL